jgi:hypothetical protein
MAEDPKPRKPLHEMTELELLNYREDLIQELERLRNQIAARAKQIEGRNEPTPKSHEDSD